MMKFSTYASRFRSLTRLQYYNPITTKIHQNHAIKQFFSKAQLRNIGYMKSPEKREELLIYFKKKFILARGALVKKRYLELDIPIGGKYTHWYTLSDMCGHGAFLFLAISYLENDFMNLRIYAISGVSLSIIFQYYREKPLWIPIRWNALFLLINITMILLLLKESSDAENLPEEQKAIFNTVFESHGMKAIDFLHLISHANRHEVKKGEKLVTLGAKHHHLHFVQSGRLSVQRPGESMPEIHEHQFVGAMSFMTWEGNLAAHQRMRHAKIEHFNQWNSDSPFNFVFTSFIGGSETKGNSTTLKLQKTSNSSSSASGNSTMKVTNCSNTGSVAANDEENDDDYNEYKDDIEEEEEVEKVEEEGLADVTCEVDCVVYSWEFRELRELLISSPNLGLVFERCISADLNLKMSNNWSRDHLRRYEQLVRWTLEASLEKIPSSSMKESSTNTNNSIDDIKKQLAQATITDKDRLLLSMYRSEYAVTDKEHELALIDLGWTTEEFHKGKKY